MDALFTAEYILTQDIYKEFFHRKTFVSRMILYVMGYFAAYAALRTVLTSVYLDSTVDQSVGLPASHLWLYAGILFAIGAIAVVSAALLPRRLAKKAFRKALRIGGDPKPKLRDSIFDDRVEQYNHATGNTFSQSLEDIKKIRGSKNLYLLMTKKSGSFIVPKDSFIKGKPGDFESFVSNVFTPKQVKL